VVLVPPGPPDNLVHPVQAAEVVPAPAAVEVQDKRAALEASEVEEIMV
jgi:hypothetical protein